MPAQKMIAKVLRVHDGDTATMELSQPINLLGKLRGKMVFCDVRCRLAGINATELKDAGGPEARDHLASMIDGKDVLVELAGIDKYDRPLVRIYLGNDPLTVNDRMVRDGHARVWDGEGPKP